MTTLKAITRADLLWPIRMNCWEFKKCGREPGGHRALELGVCPASVEKALDGAHGGRNAGRACWVVAGSFCGGRIQGTFAMKLLNCWRCDFMNMVKQEEEPCTFGFSYSRTGMEQMLEKERAADPARQDAEAGSTGRFPAR